MAILGNSDRPIDIGCGEGGDATDESAVVGGSHLGDGVAENIFAIDECRGY
jgi:hypothetical protein